MDNPIYNPHYREIQTKGGREIRIVTIKAKQFTHLQEFFDTAVSKMYLNGYYLEEAKFFNDQGQCLMVIGFREKQIKDSKLITNIERQVYHMIGIMKAKLEDFQDRIRYAKDGSEESTGGLNLKHKEYEIQIRTVAKMKRKLEEIFKDLKDDEY